MANRTSKSHYSREMHKGKRYLVTDKIPVLLWFSDTFLKEISDFMNKKGLENRSWLIRTAIREYIEAGDTK